MFRLITSEEPRWLELPQGVRVKVRPLTAIIAASAQNAGLAAYLKERAEADEVAAAGAPLDPKGMNVSNQDYVNARLAIETAEALGRYGIVAWEGVAGEDGKAMDLTPDGAARLAAHPLLRQQFLNLYNATLTAEVEEGNGSAPSRPGASDEGRNTAADASAPTMPDSMEEASPPDAEPAPTSSTDPAPPTDRPA